MPDRQSLCWTGPGWLLPVVDQVIGPEFFDSGTLRVRRGDRDNGGAHAFRELKREQSYASVTLRDNQTVIY